MKSPGTSTRPGYRPGVPQRRSSPGGNVVTGSLTAIGYHQAQSVALVETGRPRLRPYDVVLCQNAWNFVPEMEFSALARSYQPGRRALSRARRAVATVNSRRARTPVVLSHYMAGLLAYQGVRPVVSPVTLPLELCEPSPPLMRAVAGITEPFLLVPGTLTPYKNADYAIDLLRLLDPDQRPLLVLAGTDDASGHHQQLSAELVRSGLRHWIGPVNRQEMSWLLTHALTTIVPSRLESLSFSMAEALVLSSHVLASTLPVHREVAARLGREPHWLPAEPDVATAHALLEHHAVAPMADVAAYLEEWHDLGAVLTARLKDG
jgi:glycosyltransferase involved in cell wall biosynthesis